MELEVRTGSRCEGTDFIRSYRLAAPERCFLPGRARALRFLLSRGCKPKVTSRGKNWAAFRGRITAEDKLLLRPGDLLRVQSQAHYASVYNLILTRLAGDELLDVAIRANAYTSMFVDGEPANITASVMNFGPRPVDLLLRLSARDEFGKEVSRGSRAVRAAAASQTPVAWSPRLGKLGPFFVTAQVLQAGAPVATHEINIAVVPRIDLATTPDSSPFGIHKGDMQDWPPIGAKWNRLWDTGDTWNRMQPQPGPIDFTKQDATVQNARRHHVNLLFVFAYTPTWASSHPEWPHYTGGGATAAPKDINTWASYVHAVATRYKGLIRHYEIWNEPNAGFFKGTVGEYASLAKSAYRAAKLADPDSKLVGISGTGGYLPWMEKVFKLGALRFMDVVSVHTYTSPSSPEEANLLGRLAATHALIAKYGGRQPIWNTELGYWVPERNGCRPLSADAIAAKAPKDIAPNWKAGWPRRPINEYRAAAMLARHYILNVSAGVEHVFWYAWYTHAFPMFTVRGAPRMHTLAFAGAAARLSDARDVERVDLGSANLHVHIFSKPSGPMLVAWRVGAIERKLAIPATKPCRVWDMWGNADLRTPAGALQLVLSDRPQYITGPSIEAMRKTRLAGERFVFEAPDADVVADVGKRNVKEMTSRAFHGDRRVVGLPDAGDEIAWTLKAIDRALYEVRVDLRLDGPHARSYELRVDGGKPSTLTLAPAPDKEPEVTRRTAKYTMIYGELVATQPVELHAGDRVRLRSKTPWAYVGQLILNKVAELPDTEAIACVRRNAAPEDSAATWPGAPTLSLRERKQVVIGVSDRFASTHERDSWRGPSDLSAAAQTAWTPRALLVRVAVTDDAIKPSPDRGAYNGDCVELFLDLRGKGSMGAAALGSGTYQVLCVAPNSRTWSNMPPKGRFPPGTSIRGARTPAGYALVIAVPWPKGWPQTGRELGFDIAVDDADNVGDAKAKRKSQIVWRGTANNFQDPSAYGRLVLVDAARRQEK